MIFKPELSPQNFHYDVLYPLYSGITHDISFYCTPNPILCARTKAKVYSVLGIYNFDLARVLLSRKRPNKERLKYLEKIQDF